MSLFGDYMQRECAISTRSTEGMENRAYYSEKISRKNGDHRDRSE